MYSVEDIVEMSSRNCLTTEKSPAILETGALKRALRVKLKQMRVAEHSSKTIFQLCVAAQNCVVFWSLPSSFMVLVTGEEFMDQSGWMYHTHIDQQSH